MTKKEGVPFIKKVCKSGRGYLLWIPKDVVDFLSLEDKSITEVRLKNLNKIRKNTIKEGVPFIKSVCKSGRGYLLWIPKDVVDYLSLENKSIVEVRLKKLKKDEK
jgi:hypothetical protein